MVTILDCTLRDGGYVNAWRFGSENIAKISKNLVRSKFDWVEVGFLQSKQYDPETTLFRYLSQVSPFLPAARQNTKFCIMITYGEYDLDDIPVYDGSSVDGLRVIFKKNNWHQALDYCRELKNKGYEIFINPMHTYAYSDKELLDLVDLVNSISPSTFTIVDTMGIMRSDELIRIFMLIDHNLNPKIKVGFHSHNNLQLSFSNALALLDIKTKRELIIDSSVKGMGRGAGNLPTELLMQYLNDNFETNYNLLPILGIMDECIEKIYSQSPWGYNTPYYLAAAHNCHPNYATFLADKQTISVYAINAILSSIPNENKNNYNEAFIQSLYLNYQCNEIDDSKSISILQDRIGDKKILILGPGQSITEYQKDIGSFIAQEAPFIITLNFRPNLYSSDLTFITNAKRFAEQKNLTNTAITSNITHEACLTFNYGSYINNSAMTDNSLLILIKLLSAMGVKEIYLAGCDGFKHGNDNYYKKEMINNAKLGDFDKRNAIMSQMLEEMAKKIKIHFLTPSLYQW